MRSLLLFSAVLALSAPAAAQKPCMDVNTGMAMPTTLATRAPAWVVARYATTQALTRISGLEIGLGSGVPGVPVNVAIFAVDPTSGEPAAQLASGTAVVNPENRLYSARLSPPTLSLATGTEFYVGAEIGPLAQGTARIMYDPAGAGLSGPLYVGSPGSWALFRVASIQFRVFCDSHIGAFASYGQGKVGHNGVAPGLYGLGFPNLGNQIALQAAGAAPSQPAILAIGARSSTASPPLGTLYVLPIVATVAGTTSLVGCVDYELPVPNDPSLTGNMIAWQSWIIDPAAAAGIAHTDAIESLLGN